MGAIGVAGIRAIGIMVSTAVLGFFGISVIKRMNMQNDQRLHQEVTKKRR